MRILLVAEESAGVQVLRALAAGEQQPVAVLTAGPSSGAAAPVSAAATSLGVRTLPSERVRDPSLATWIRDEAVDLLLNVHSLFVMHEDVVAAPGIGSFNLHPGPLPDYAGLNAPSWAIYNGEVRHGVTVHWMEPGIDTGPIAYQEAVEIAPADTGLSLSVKCVRRGVPLVLELVRTAAADPAGIPRAPQELGRRRYFGREIPNDGAIVWSETAQRIVDFVRASDYAPFASPWGHPWTTLDGRRVEVLKAARTERPADKAPATIGEVDDDVALVAAADEWVALSRIRVDGERAATQDVLRPGRRLG